jgi:hypothetical protein
MMEGFIRGPSGSPAVCMGIASLQPQPSSGRARNNKPRVGQIKFLCGDYYGDALAFRSSAAGGQSWRGRRIGVLSQPKKLSTSLSHRQPHRS